MKPGQPRKPRILTPEQKAHRRRAAKLAYRERIVGITLARQLRTK